MKGFVLGALLLVFAGGLLMVFGPVLAGETLLKKGDDLMEKAPKGYPVATLAGGCFWCTESEYRELDGVLYTRVGYIGGHVDNPKYEDTHNSKSGHAEAVEVTYDPNKISYRDLLEFFFTKAHDPTQLNRQGPDVGTEYRSAVFYHNDEQKKIAEEVIKELTEAHRFSKAIVTTLEPATTFWQAEDYHQQYFEKYREKTGRDHINVIVKKSGR